MDDPYFAQRLQDLRLYGPSSGIQNAGLNTAIIKKELELLTSGDQHCAIGFYTIIYSYFKSKGWKIYQSLSNGCLCNSCLGAGTPCDHFLDFRTISVLPLPLRDTERILEGQKEGIFNACLCKLRIASRKQTPLCTTIQTTLLFTTPPFGPRSTATSCLRPPLPLPTYSKWLARGKSAFHVSHINWVNVDKQSRYSRSKHRQISTSDVTFPDF